ncbi:MAG: NAD(P)H-binding protein, partial [Planctomycetes bacterium]|nr:NAD(P)H-binding protein [Planctomycetota bacterium]
MEAKRVIIVGASGMIGGLALRGCLDDDAVGAVTVLVRRPIGIDHPKLSEVIHSDYADYSGVADALVGQDAALFCLGAYTGSVPDDEFRKITVDYAVNFARALHPASPDAAFCFLSGAGADQTGRSRMAFARYKGEAEKTLLGVGFPRVHIF